MPTAVPIMKIKKFGSVKAIFIVHHENTTKAKKIAKSGAQNHQRGVGEVIDGIFENPC